MKTLRPPKIQNDKKTQAEILGSWSAVGGFHAGI